MFVLHRIRGGGVSVGVGTSTSMTGCVIASNLVPADDMTFPCFCLNCDSLAT